MLSRVCGVRKYRVRGLANDTSVAQPFTGANTGRPSRVSPNASGPAWLRSALGGTTHTLHMTTLRKVSGTWRGTYSYDPVEHIPKLEPVPFSLTLKQGWFGRFTGSVTDGGRGSMPGTGVIEGYFSFPRIEFTKRMPVCYVVTPDGRNVTLREFLIEQGHTCERDVPHTPIFYEGEFSSQSKAQGTWIIRAGPVSLGDGRAIQMPEARGGWSIES